MKYGCRGDPSLMLFIGNNNSSLNSTERYSFALTSYMSSVSSSENTADNLAYGEEAVQNIMENNNIEGNTNIRNELMMFVVNTLYEQIASLKDQITFLKAESLTKNSTIGQLFNQLSTLRSRNQLPHSNSSMLLDEIIAPLKNSSLLEEDSTRTDYNVINMSCQSLNRGSKTSVISEKMDIEISSEDQQISIDIEIDDVWDNYINASVYERKYSY